VRDLVCFACGRAGEWEGIRLERAEQGDSFNAADDHEAGGLLAAMTTVAVRPAINATSPAAGSSAMRTGMR
jgi:hypothetical protein